MPTLQLLWVIAYNQLFSVDSRNGKWYNMRPSLETLPSFHHIMLMFLRSETSGTKAVVFEGTSEVHKFFSFYEKL